LHHWKLQKLRVILPVNRRNMTRYFQYAVSDDNKQAYMKTEAYKLYSRVFGIFLPNVNKIDPYNFEQYRFKVLQVFARMPDETDARSIITASPSENWMKTIQQDLRSNNL